jgi:5-methylcytosine-specific restriction protein B
MDEFRRTCLADLRSAFLPAGDPDAALVWTSESAHELVRRFIDQPDISKRSFVEKLRDQLAEVSRSADQLLVELTWLHVVISKALRYETKRQLLMDVASIAGAELPSGLYDEALHRGLVSPGTSFATRRPNQLWLLIRFAETWLAATPNQRDAWLGDGWAFREMVFSLEGVADQTQRHALLHLVHPETFEDSVSQYHKRAMASLATPDEVGPNDDVTIANVRRRLTTELGEGFGFYDKSVRERWQPDEPETSPAPADTPDAKTPDEPVIERSAWLIRGSGGERVPDWLERGVCGIAFDDTFPFDLETGASRDDFRRLSEEAGVDVTAGGFNNELGQVWRFVNKIEVGDYVVTVNGSDVFLGVVDSPPRNVGARTRKETVRTVEWLNAENPVARANVAPAVYSKLRTLLTVSNITSVIDDLERWVTERPWDTKVQPQISRALTLARADGDLEHDLLLPQSWLNEVIELLEEKRQLVLYGPPGTGKTFVAQRLADHLTAHGGTSELVQFHPSYTYEDFFEGYRPVPSAGGAVAFEIKPGPLRRLAQTATAEPDDPHVLIVDEINRANLAKVFGELYFLLEYRDKVMTLQYSDEEFSLPGNLFVIGTMNTADRSIALVDAAMRRRFYFAEMAPTVTPIDGLLARWLHNENLDVLPARLLAELNSRLDDPDAAIGPSYLMTRTIAEPGRLERIWNHAILPLLEERFYGTGEDLRRFSYETVLAAVRSAEP